MNRFLFEGATRTRAGREDVQVLVQPCNGEGLGWKREALTRESMIKCVIPGIDGFCLTFDLRQSVVIFQGGSCSTYSTCRAHPLSLVVLSSVATSPSSTLTDSHRWEDASNSNQADVRSSVLDGQSESQSRTRLLAQPESTQVDPSAEIRSSIGGYDASCAVYPQCRSYGRRSGSK